MEESASPFIDEGDGLTSEGGSTNASSLVAHTDGRRTMVDAHNTIDVTVECQMHMGGHVIFFRKDGRRYLQILFDA